MKTVEFTIEAAVENLGAAQGFVEQQLEEAGCPLKMQMQISLAVEEIFVNVASYAYVPGTGMVTIGVELREEAPRLTLRFSDSGRPFDPTAKLDPNLALSAEDRPIGGLGIYMTKKLMDEVHYEYRNAQNVLTMRKSW